MNYCLLIVTSYHLLQISSTLSPTSKHVCPTKLYPKDGQLRNISKDAFTVQCCSNFFEKDGHCELGGVQRQTVRFTVWILQAERAERKHVQRELTESPVCISAFLAILVNSAQLNAIAVQFRYATIYLDVCVQKDLQETNVIKNVIQDILVLTALNNAIVCNRLCDQVNGTCACPIGYLSPTCENTISVENTVITITVTVATGLPSDDDTIITEKTMKSSDNVIRSGTSRTQNAAGLASGNKLK
ncbi:unnamed protein product [Mytilus edulis]|uniref:EGF-like domain-containing protein n=1 Tax=Mytilus edulis TaxID=6550 RepID=A0A8S3TN72_MYTED|nr:unnamed protein product [Mytilus edulis]